MSKTVVLRASAISKRFGKRLLFDIPDLFLEGGQAIYLQGENGAGKTTLLKILAGLLRPSTGQVNRFGNRVIYLHQTPYLFDGSVLDNLCYGLRFQVPNRLQRNDKALAALSQVGLTELARQHVSTLSGGEQQRIAMARAAVLTPRALLMDEPSANLDSASVDTLTEQTSQLLRQGTSILLTSHQPSPLTALCRQQWTLHHQRLEREPEP